MGGEGRTVSLQQFTIKRVSRLSPYCISGGSILQRLGVRILALRPPEPWRRLFWCLGGRRVVVSVNPRLQPCLSQHGREVTPSAPHPNSGNVVQPRVPTGRSTWLPRMTFTLLIPRVPLDPSLKSSPCSGSASVVLTAAPSLQPRCPGSLPSTGLHILASTLPRRQVDVRAAFPALPACPHLPCCPPSSSGSEGVG